MAAETVVLNFDAQKVCLGFKVNISDNIFSRRNGIVLCMDYFVCEWTTKYKHIVEFYIKLQKYEHDKFILNTRCLDYSAC